MTASIFSENVRFEPWWWEAAPPVPAADVALPARVDVAVVGAGFTGLSAALELARAWRSVVVLEAGDLGRGASKRNGGMIGSGHRVGLAAFTKRYGRDATIAPSPGRHLREADGRPPGASRSKPGREPRPRPIDASRPYACSPCVCQVAAPHASNLQEIAMMMMQAKEQ